MVILEHFDKLAVTELRSNKLSEAQYASDGPQINQPNFYSELAAIYNYISIFQRPGDYYTDFSLIFVSDICCLRSMELFWLAHIQVLLS